MWIIWRLISCCFDFWDVNENWYCMFISIAFWIIGNYPPFCLTFVAIFSALIELPGVLWVLPDSYLDVPNKDYGGEWSGLNLEFT